MIRGDFLERSANFNFYLPSRDGADLADINQISENFRTIDVQLVPDKALDETSERAISNKAVATGLKSAVEQKPFKLIEKITLEEDATVARSQTPDGEAYNFSEMKVVIKFINPTSNINAYCRFWIEPNYANGSSGSIYLPNAGLQGKVCYATYTAKISPYNNGVQDNNYIADFYASSSSPSASPVYSCVAFGNHQEGNIPSYFTSYTGKFKKVDIDTPIPAGTIVYIIAR